MRLINKLILIGLVSLLALPAHAQSVRERLRKARETEQSEKTKLKQRMKNHEIIDTNDNPETQTNIKKKDITIYVTSWCPHCKTLEDFLKTNNIEYKKYDIEKSAYGKRNYRKLGGEGIPLIKIDNQLISGFHPEKIKRALDIP